eukprot:1160256-Pelagomonas_calceolata.AAC.7
MQRAPVDAAAGVDFILISYARTWHLHCTLTFNFYLQRVVGKARQRCTTATPATAPLRKEKEEKRIGKEQNQLRHPKSA